MTNFTAQKMVNILVALRKLPPLSELSGEEERLLFELYAVRENKADIWVSEVFDLGGAKSSSTAYRNLMGLKNKGLVEIAVDDEDKRKRRVTFSKTALQLLAAIA